MDFDIKKGCYKNVEGEALPNLMKEVFGDVKKEGDAYVSAYGIMTRIEVKVISKEQLDIVTVNRDGPMTDEEILDSKRKLNEFAFKATGFDAKARMKRAQKKAKEGKL